MNVQNNMFTLLITIQNKPGALFKISGLIRKHRFNIESMTLARTENTTLHHLTMLLKGDKEMAERLSKQLSRIIEVVKVSEPGCEDIVTRELALIKVSLTQPGSQEEILQLLDLFRFQVIDIHPDYLMLELTGNIMKIEAFYEHMKKFGVLEFVRTATTGLVK